MKKFLIILIFFLVPAGYYSHKYWQETAIDVTLPSKGPAILAVYATGTVEASVTIPVAPRSSARLMQLFSDEGQIVTKGMVMAQLEDADLQKILADRKAAEALAQKDYDRQLKLSKSGASSKQALDKAIANLESAQANVAQAEANLSYMKLLAPEDGIVIRRDGEIGELIPANQPVLWLSCCQGLRVAAEVDEEDIALVKPGQKVVIHADAFPGEVFNGIVQSITPKGDPVSRSYRVRISLPKDSKLMIGMTAETNIIIDEKKEAILVPPSAVANDKVFVFKNGIVKHQNVTTGTKSDGKIEIKDGLSMTDIVVIDGSLQLQDGKSIRVHMK